MARAAVPGRLNWLVGRLAGTRQETATARTLILDVPGWPGHLPGQHVDVRLTAEDGYSTERSYSIASAPDGTRLELTIQRLEDGEVSPYLTEILAPGDPLELRGPIGGYFAWRPATRPAPPPAPPVLLIGGGSGVVPLMAMVRTRAAVGSTVAMRLIYSARRPGTLLYADELARLAVGGDGLGVHILYTRQAPPGWEGPPGRLDGGLLRRLAGPPADGAQYFVCGPTGFVEDVADLLTGQGVPAGQIRTERFGPGGAPAAEERDE
jgi:ferredoxin-NADP reductase